MARSNTRIKSNNDDGTKKERQIHKLLEGGKMNGYTTKWTKGTPHGSRIKWTQKKYSQTPEDKLKFEMELMRRIVKIKTGGKK